MRKSTHLTLILFTALFILGSCKKETEIEKDPLVVAFKEKSTRFNEIKEQHKVELVFSEKPTKNGSVIIKLKGEDMVYAVDYKTNPEAKNDALEVPFRAGAEKLEFTYLNLIPPQSKTRKLTFVIEKINYDTSLIQGNTSLVFSFEESLGGEFIPTIGGSTQPNQVFIDLSSKTEKLVKRDTWTLGFYAGETFNVILNETNFSNAGAINATNIDEVTEEDFKELQPKVTVFTYKPEDGIYSDDPEKDFAKNAIKPIELEADKNKVYLLNLGRAISTKTPKVGSVSIAGEKLGWRKIRVLRKDKGYLLQYAELNSKTHKEIFIPKSKIGHTFTYFDVVSEKIVSVAPRAKDWDISFTAFTEKFPNGMSYGYSDYVTSNKFGGVKMYQYKEEEGKNYSEFKKADVDESKLISSRRIPGSKWRNVFKKQIVSGVFYVIKDTNGNLYKLKFLQLVNEKGERGHSKFMYELLK